MYSNVLKDDNSLDLNEPKFNTAFNFIKRGDLLSLPVGWIELENGVRASVQEYETMDPTTILFETHDRYWDLQYMVKGKEKVGVVSRYGLRTKIKYDEKEDIEFYEEPQDSGEVYLSDGTFVLLAPEDAHKPRSWVTKPEKVKKIVVKIPV